MCMSKHTHAHTHTICVCINVCERHVHDAWMDVKDVCICVCVCVCVFEVYRHTYTYICICQYTNIHKYIHIESLLSWYFLISSR